MISIVYLKREWFLLQGVCVFVSKTSATREGFNRVLHLSFFGMDKAYHPTHRGHRCYLSIQQNSRKITLKSFPRRAAQICIIFCVWSSTNGEIVHFLVWPGSLLSITEITEYKYFSLLKRSRELKYKSELNIVPLVLITEPNSFVWSIPFTFDYTRVGPQYDFCILGRSVQFVLLINVGWWATSQTTLDLTTLTVVRRKCQLYVYHKSTFPGFLLFCVTSGLDRAEDELHEGRDTCGRMLRHRCDKRSFSDGAIKQCCSVMQCVAVCCSVLQCIAVFSDGAIKQSKTAAKTQQGHNKAQQGCSSLTSDWVRLWVLAATHCNTLQHTATHRNTLQHTATHCNTLQRTRSLAPCHCCIEFVWLTVSCLRVCWLPPPYFGTFYRGTDYIFICRYVAFSDFELRCSNRSGFWSN